MTEGTHKTFFKKYHLNNFLNFLKIPYNILMFLLAKGITIIFKLPLHIIESFSGFIGKELLSRID
jgi:hypothetical protein